MNKQKLAATIWESANEMRSKIEANEYKDFILGFIFYKYLSERELRFFRAEGMSDTDIAQMDESDKDFMDYTKEEIGYYIAYENLFSTWIDKKNDFDVSDVRRALSAFDRLIGPSHKKVFERIFNTLQSGLSKLGESASAQTKAISALLQLIRKIPMDGKQDYDVLGFIYEYLISMFAANAGKKAGEFYTPHEVSVLMSEIVAEHLKGRKTIRIYDPTSGSGSLLITIGAAAAKHIAGKNKIIYYAQELKENTYNLTRMNLVMRGIDPKNIFVRNGDTLEDDWPLFEDSNPEGYQLVRVDAVISNPPYSQKWDPTDKKYDLRFSDFGVAPKGKADYAFLLHELYHLKKDGIMTIVLPHGVLFRGNEEAEIRKNLIEKNHIDAIIGLPANIFFGTSIPTIIMVLKRERKNTDVLIIDASKGYAKSGKSNVLRASDIKRIADTVRDRAVIPGFSVRADKDLIRKNEYNLNIPRYVDSFAPPEHWDIHSIMFGGIPNRELDELDAYWLAMPGLRESLFVPISPEYVECASDDIDVAIKEAPAAVAFREAFERAFIGFDDYLKQRLLRNYKAVSLASGEETLTNEIFARIGDISAIDRYEAYQVLDNAWSVISPDIEMLQTEGDTALTAVDPNMVTKQKDGEDVEIQNGWVGHILPFALVQEMLLPDDLAALSAKEAELSALSAMFDEILDSLSEEERDSAITADGNASFSAKGVREKVDEILEDVETEEIAALAKYLKLSRKAEKAAYVAHCTSVDWSAMEASANGSFTKTVVTNRITLLKRQHQFPADSIEDKLLRVLSAMETETQLKREIRDMRATLHEKTRVTILGMDYETALKVLEAKWIVPILDGIAALPEHFISDLIEKLVHILEKYQVTFAEVGDKISKTEKTVSTFVSQLRGSDSDMDSLVELRKLLGGVPE